MKKLSKLVEGVRRFFSGDYVTRTVKNPFGGSSPTLKETQGFNPETGEVVYRGYSGPNGGPDFIRCYRGQ